LVTLRLRLAGLSHRKRRKPSQNEHQDQQGRRRPQEPPLTALLLTPPQIVEAAPDDAGKHPEPRHSLQVALRLATRRTHIRGQRFDFLDLLASIRGRAADLAQRAGKRLSRLTLDEQGQDPPVATESPEADDLLVDPL